MTCEWCQKECEDRFPVWIKRKSYQCCIACYQRVRMDQFREASKDKRVSFLFGGNAGKPASYPP